MEDVALLASEQNGLITTAQAARLGVDRISLHRAAHGGTLRSIRRGVYAFESAPLAPDEELRAAWLSLDPSRTVAERLATPEHIVIATTSAATQYGIGDFETQKHEFYTTSRKQTRADDIRLRIRSLQPQDVEVRQGLPLTAPTRIIIDLLAEHQDLGHISQLVADAVQQGLSLDWGLLAARAREFAGDYQLTPEGLLTALAESTESTTTTAQVALSMLASTPDLKEEFSTQLAAAVHQISTALVTAHRDEISPALAHIAPDLPATQQPHAELARQVAARLPALQLPDLTELIHRSSHREAPTHRGDGPATIDHDQDTTTYPA